MSVNVVPVSSRSAGLDDASSANGSYTLPKYAFVPHAATQPFATGFVPSPGGGPVQSASFAAPPQLQRPYPQPDLQGVYGLRSVQVKASA